MHPIVSVITGELKCRGSYIDENGLDVHRHRVTSYPLQRVELPLLLGGTDKLSATRYRNGMCASIISKRIPISPSIECYHHRATDAIAFDIVRILPAMGPMIESAEAIVIVVGEQDTQHRLEEDKTYDNANGDWYDRSDMNASIMHMIQKLGNKETCPWLTKNVFIVSPVLHEGNAPIEKGSSTDLADAVDAFIASYTGSTNSNVRPLPPDFSYPMIRSLLVLSDVPTTPYSFTNHHTEVRILPQGKGGTLPNLDLMFSTQLSFQSQPASEAKRISTVYYGDSEFRVHPYRELEMNMRKRLEILGTVGVGLEKLFGWKEGRAKNAVDRYAKDFGGWLGFIKSLVVGT